MTSIPEDFFNVGNTSVKRELLEAAGPFDEAFRHHAWDDHEMGLRLRDCGMRSMFLPDAPAEHFHRITLRTRCIALRRAGEAAVHLECKYPGRHAWSSQLEHAPWRHRWKAFRAIGRYLGTRDPEALQSFYRRWMSAAFVEGHRRTLRRRANPKMDLIDRTVAWPTADGVGLESVSLPDGVVTRGEGRLESRNPDGGPQAYFRMPRGVLATGQGVEVSVEVSAVRAGDILLQYDSADLSIEIDAHVPGAFRETPPVSVDANRWVTCSFRIDDARFGRAINGCDFRVLAPGGPHDPIRLRRVAVRGAGFPEPDPDDLAPFPEPAEPVGVSIVIPVFNRIDLTLRCLRAVRTRTRGSYEVIVVDDGSTDDSRAILRSIPGLRLVTLEENGGYARACNAGSRQARGRWLVLLNNDTEPDVGWLSELLRVAGGNPEIGVVGSLLFFPGRRHVQHQGIEFTPEGLPFHQERLLAAGSGDARETHEMEAVTGACMLTETDLYHRLGGLDAGFVNGYEDIDYCLRVRRFGRRVVYCGTSTLVHHESATLGVPDDSIHASNRRHFLARWAFSRPFGDQVERDRGLGVEVAEVDGPT